MTPSIPHIAPVKPLGRNWTVQRINRELRRRGYTQAWFVKSLGKSQVLVSEVVSGRSTSLPVATAIAAVLGRTPREIWPRIYGKPVPEPAMSTDAATTEPTGGPNPPALAS